MDAFALRRRTASRTRSKTGIPSTFVPALPGVTPATTLVPNSRIARVWNWPWWPVIPWTTTLAFFVRRTAMSPASRFHFDRELRGVLDRLRRMGSNRPEDLFRRGLVHALDAGDDGNRGMRILESLLDAGRDRVGLRDPAEDVHEDHRGVRFDQEFECLFDLLRIVGASQVEAHAASSAFHA